MEVRRNAECGGGDHIELGADAELAGEYIDVEAAVVVKGRRTWNASDGIAEVVPGKGNVDMPVDEDADVEQGG